LTENSEHQFVAQTAETTKIESVYAVALYDPDDGSIRHMHHAVSMTGSLPNNPETIEKEAISNATRYGHNVNNLKILHIENLNDAASQYRVDVKTQKLVKLHKLSMSDVFKENTK
jgi:hypothetical protein